MSDANPFEAPSNEESSNAPVQATLSPPPQVPAGPVPIPTSLLVICIVGLVLGLFGLFGTCMGGGMLAMSEMLIDVLPDEDAKAATRELLDLQFIPTIIQLVLSVIISPLLLAACIGALIRKRWSQGLLKLALIGSIISSILTLGVTLWLMLFHWEALVAPNAGQPGGEIATIVGQVMAVGFSVIGLAFFVWSFFALGNKKITAFYEAI